MATSPFSLPTVGSDNPLSSEYLALERQKKIADLLMQKGQEQPQGQMVSGHYVAPSWAQQINPLVNSYVGSNLASQNEAKTADLAKLLRGQGVDEINKFNDLLQTDPQKAYQFAATATNPTLQKAGLDNMLPKAPLIVPQGSAVLKQNPDKSYTQSYLNPKELELSTDIKTALALNPNLPRNPDNWTKEDALQAQQTIALHKKMSAPQSTTYVDARSATSLAGPIGEMLKGSKEATVGAYNNLTSANAILANVDKAITGSAANQRIGLSQLASTLGLGNAKNPESLAATRTLIQNMARLQIGTHVKGEGAVSDFERRLKAAAEGGNIDFTPVEIKQMANTTKNSANYQIQQHNDAIKSAQGLGSDSAAIANMYKINPPLQSGVQYLGPVK